MKSTQAMRDRIRELMAQERDDYDRAVECVLDDFEALLAKLVERRAWLNTQARYSRSYGSHADAYDIVARKFFGED